MNYESIFRERGSSYDQAMRNWPDARREEFRIPVQLAGITPGSVVVDVPAGGGYLQRYLPESSSWYGHEPCADFLEGASALDQSLLPLPWQENFADAAISLAGLHHMADKRPLFQDIRRVLRPGGRFVLADAHEDSPVARFLDVFVGRHNSTGHDGIYLNDQTVCDLHDCGLAVEKAQRTRYCWWFADRREMGEFCRLLFDIRSIGWEQVIQGIEAHLGISESDGRLGMNWELFMVAGVRAPDPVNEAVC